uniref:Uncharacterized protein n=1 Tax=Setaria italica TaxID=4555 RepID=K3YY71_SETIT
MEPTGADDSEPIASRRLGMEDDLTRTCRRDRYCGMCLQAFCSHCCHEEHWRWPCAVIPVGVDDAGQPTFCKRYPAPDGDPIKGYLINFILEHDYAARLARRQGRLLHQERNGRRYVRCRGDEKCWLAHVERILGDPVGEDC